MAGTGFQYKKGESGNPAGRKKGVPNKLTQEVRDLAREHGPAAIAKLAHLMENAKDERARVQAAQILLDRAYGKPGQTVSQENSGEIKVTIVGTDAKL